MSETVYNIRELNLNIINPRSASPEDIEFGGSKTVVIGKPGCFIRGTKILMYNGEIKNVEDVKVGDQLMGDDSTARTVQELCQNTDLMYKILPKHGDFYIVNRLHKLVLMNNLSNDIIEITVEDYLKETDIWKQSWCIFRTSVDFKENEIDMDPYLLGLWLGDRLNTKTTNIDSSLKKYNLINNKHIPHNYKVNTTNNRLQLLAGLLDICGSINKYGYHFVNKNEILCTDIVFLARSLGFAVTKDTITKVSEDGTEENYYKCFISGDIQSIPCKMIRREDSPFLTSKCNHLLSDFTVVDQGEDEYFGFTIDGNHRFLLASFDVVRNTGKTTLIASLLHAKKHIFPVGIVMSGTEDSNGFYRKIFPSTFVFNQYDEEQIKKFVKRQKIARQYLPNPWAVILIDDCTDDPTIFNKPLQHGMYKRGRHWNMWYILSLQYAMDVKPVIRTNVDGVYILREPTLKIRRCLWENYASIIPDFALFNELMDALTDDYCAMYIHNRITSNDWKDCVFWYKAPKDLPDFKFGCPEYWKFHYDRFNPSFVDSFDM